ncbi:MAG: right-handed parallel beta-helix repeat-containing protein [Candidatus Hodarchaeales archaeon]
MKQNTSFFILIVTLLLVGMSECTMLDEIQPAVEGVFANKMTARQRTPTHKVTSTQAYIERGPIIITSNFLLNSSFPGKGTMDEPIRIKGYNITSSSNTLISISDTTYYFCIENNLLNGLNPTGADGILLDNVTHGKIYNNTISNNLYAGITMGEAKNNIIANNTIYGSNIIQDHGIVVEWSSDNNIFANNTIYNCNSVGIAIGDSENNTFSGNYIFDPNDTGNQAIGLNNANNTTISDNKIEDHNQALGFVSTSHSRVANNVIVNCNFGIDLHTSSNNNSIAQNVIYSCEDYGIRLENSINNTTISYNDFADNTPWSTSQAFDNGSNNVFVNNFWKNWSGIGSYACDGSAGNGDSSPLMNPFHISEPSITAPTAGTLPLTGNVSIQWTAASDIFDHSLTYSVFYSANDGGSWSTLASGLTTTNYALDTTTIVNGTSILLKIHVIDSLGFVVKTISNESFLIFNPPHQLSTLNITTPIKDDTLTGQVDITWTPAMDTWNHEVNYNLYYSSDDGAIWTQLAGGLTSTSYSWNTTTVPNGFSYRIKVVATCSGGLTEINISESFTIQNPTFTTTTSSSASKMGNLIGLIALGILITVRKSRKR